MGSRIISSLLAMALIFALPVFSLADGEEVALKNSGSPEVSMMAMRSIAANEGISLAAAEGNSGQFGYNIEPFSPSFYSQGFSQSSPTDVRFISVYYPSESFVFDLFFEFNFPITFFQVYDRTTGSNIFTANLNSYSYSFSFDTSSIIGHELAIAFRFGDIDIDSLYVVDSSFSRLTPVEGISSGYTYSSGIIPNTTRSIFDTISADFGNQPAGKYLINIYHWGDSYDVTYQISDPTESYYLPCSTDGSVTTLVYNHPGGDFTLEGSFTASNNETSVVDGNIYGGGQGNYMYIGGDIQADGPLSWVFNITDIVAIPYETAADHNFGIFAPIIGFFNDHFASLKSFLADQFDKDEEAYTGATSPELSQDINSASSMIEQEQQFMTDINTQITDQSSKVDPITVIDGIDGANDVFSSMLWVSSIVSSGIDGMGVFQFLIYVPMILGIVTLVIGRGASLAGRRPRATARPVNVTKGK